MDFILKTILYVTVVVAEPEGDGSYNYLLEHKNGGTTRQYSISFSYPEDIKLKEGQSLYMGIDAKCQLVWALDDTSRPDDDYESFGTPRRSYICNANEVIIGDRRLTALVRKNNE